MTAHVLYMLAQVNKYHAYITNFRFPFVLRDRDTVAWIAAVTNCQTLHARKLLDLSDFLKSLFLLDADDFMFSNFPALL